MSELYTVIVSNTAKRMLTEHLVFLAKVNKDAAKRTKQSIIKKLYSLETYPQKYPFFKNSIYLVINIENFLLNLPTWFYIK